MNLEQAIKTAIEYENKVYSTYKEAQEVATDEVGKKIFGVLAKEEKGHIDYLEHCLSEWQKTGKLTVEKLDTVVPPEDRIRAGLEAMKQKVAGEKKQLSTQEVEYMQKAVEAEQTTSGFYKKMVAELDAEGQQLFARFVEIEEGHLAIVRAEMDAAQGLGYWFDMPEWQFQDG
jgi:rubrerythrin